MTKYKLTLNFYFSASLSPVIIPNLKNYFSMSSTHSLFMLRQPQKPALADALWTKLTPEAKTQPKGNVQYALDGGALLHRVPRLRGSPIYKVVRKLYCTYVKRNYGRAIVFFEGYNEMSAKVMTQ